jgi:hypothetical protein
MGETPLDIQVRFEPWLQGITWMPSKDKDQIQLLQCVFDLIALRALATMG